MNQKRATAQPHALILTGKNFLDRGSSERSRARRIIAIELDLHSFARGANGDDRTGTMVLRADATSNQAFVEPPAYLVVLDVATLLKKRRKGRMSEREKMSNEIQNVKNAAVDA